MLFCKFNCKEYYNSNRENYGSLLKKLILRGTAQILTEVVTKFNRLVKYLMIFGGGRFHLQRRSQLTISQNQFTEVDKIVRLGKSIYWGSQKCPPPKIDLRRRSKMPVSVNYLRRRRFISRPPPKILARLRSPRPIKRVCVYIQNLGFGAAVSHALSSPPTPS